MTDQKNGQEYLSFVLEKLQARLAEISQSLLDGQKEIENMQPAMLPAARTPEVLRAVFGG